MVPVREPAAASRAPSPLSPPLRQARGLLLDRLGVVASSLCAVHCALMPALLAAAPALHGEGAHRHGGPLGADPCGDRHGRASGPI
ncbi:MAG: MerC family mercury resistance protein [Polyangiaceae bacterium]|nr:MerC family mercury resistance protein [Polyangiaceae bacterium]